MVRKFLLVGLAISGGFAAWVWLRPYAWRPAPEARCSVLETLVTRDTSFCWLNIHLKVNPGMSHDLKKPVVLETDGGSFGPADTLLAGADLAKPEEMWFKFWVERGKLAGPIFLRINDGRLSIKSTSSIPEIEDGSYRNFTTHRW